MRAEEEDVGFTSLVVRNARIHSFDVAVKGRINQTESPSPNGVIKCALTVKDPFLNSPFPFSTQPFRVRTHLITLLVTGLRVVRPPFFHTTIKRHYAWKYELMGRPTPQLSVYPRHATNLG